MGDAGPVKENDGRSGDDPNLDYSVGKRGGRPDSGGRDRATQEKESGFSRRRSYSSVDIGQVERMRKAIVKIDDRATWRDGLIIAGAIILAICVVATLVLASAINARANRIIENDAIRAREGGQIVTRLEGKLDGGIAVVEDNSRKLDALLTTTTATTTVAPRTTATRPRTTPTATTRPTPPTTAVRPTTTTTKVLAPATTLPPCKFALLNICLSR